MKFNKQTAIPHSIQKNAEQKNVKTEVVAGDILFRARTPGSVNHIVLAIGPMNPQGRIPVIEADMVAGRVKKSFSQHLPKNFLLLKVFLL